MKTKKTQTQAKLTLFSHVVHEVIKDLEVLLENTAAQPDGILDMPGHWNSGRRRLEQE